MKKYIGTKQISAKPMNRLEYNIYRGWDLPDDENGSDEGYLVEYLDGGKSNDDRHKGYISWSPTEQFENAYQNSGNMSFGHAVELLKSGAKIARTGWNGKGMWLRHVSPYNDAHFRIEETPEAEGTLLPYIGMKTADNGFIPWLASQADVLAEDWCIVE